MAEVLKEKKKIEISEPDAEVNERFMGISSGFRAAKYITLIFLVVFLVAMTSIFRHDITAENFKYLMRYLSTTALEYTGDYRTIYYDQNNVTDIGLFNNDIAVLKNNMVSLFDMQGNNTFNYDLNYTDSMMVSAGKYILVYDMGSGRYDIVNNFTSLHSETFEYPITAAAISPNGTYAVVTKDIQFRSLIKIYDSHFRLITNIYKDKYVMDIEINESGSELLIVSSYAENGDFATEVMTYSPYTDKPKSTQKINGCMAVSCGYHKGGSYTVLCDSKLVFFDKNGNISGEYDFGNSVPTKCLYSDNYTILTFDRSIVGEQSIIMFFDKKGKQTASGEINEKILDFEFNDGFLYILSENKLYRFHPTNNELKYCGLENGGTKLFIYDRNTALVAFTGKIKVYSLAKLFDASEADNNKNGSQNGQSVPAQTSGVSAADAQDAVPEE